ncbi:MAG: hypothetical protein WA837_15790 [Xanthobacteraceae bacterium]
MNKQTKMAKVLKKAEKREAKKAAKKGNNSKRKSIGLTYLSSDQILTMIGKQTMPLVLGRAVAEYKAMYLLGEWISGSPNWVSAASATGRYPTSRP